MWVGENCVGCECVVIGIGDCCGDVKIFGEVIFVGVEDGLGKFCGGDYGGEVVMVDGGKVECVVGCFYDDGEYCGFGIDFVVDGGEVVLIDCVDDFVGVGEFEGVEC